MATSGWQNFRSRVGPFHFEIVAIVMMKWLEAIRLRIRVVDWKPTGPPPNWNCREHSLSFAIPAGS